MTEKEKAKKLLEGQYVYEVKYIEDITRERTIMIWAKNNEEAFEKAKKYDLKEWGEPFEYDGSAVYDVEIQDMDNVVSERIKE